MFVGSRAQLDLFNIHNNLILFGGRGLLFVLVFPLYIMLDINFINKEKSIDIEDTIEFFKKGSNIFKYEPVSIIVHFGKTADSGHYVNVSKHNGLWYLYNDTIRTQLESKTPKDVLDDVTNSNRNLGVMGQPVVILLKKIQ